MFKIGRTRGQNSGIEPTPVVHKGREVETVRRFLDANPEVLEEMGRVGAVTEAFNAVGDKWGEAWKVVEQEVDHDLENTGSQEEPNGVTCPCCGETFDYLPNHLPTCAA
jgi:hypothetical protein